MYNYEGTKIPKKIQAGNGLTVHLIKWKKEYVNMTYSLERTSQGE